VPNIFHEQIKVFYYYIMKNSRTKRKKIGTRKNNNVKNINEKIVTMFLQMLNTVKLYHWKTTSYAQHKATDELYSNLNENIDKFVEVMLGKTGGRVNLTGKKSLPLLDYNDVNAFTKEINKYKEFMINMSIYIDNKESDLLNIRDEILGDLNKFLYLLTFK